MSESFKRQTGFSVSVKANIPHTTSERTADTALTHDTIVRVRYAETDKMGVVYYGNYYIYFEIGRVEYMRNMGIDYRRMEIEDDSLIVVAESSCRYRRPARYDDPLRIRTRVLSVKRRTIHFGYEILHDETGELLATGETAHVACNSAGRPKALPEKYRGILEGAVSLPERLEEE